MGCGCGGVKVEALTTNQAQALIDAAREQAAMTEQEAMVASAAKAIGNANSGSSAQR